MNDHGEESQELASSDRAQKVQENDDPLANP